MYDCRFVLWSMFFNDLFPQSLVHLFILFSYERASIKQSASLATSVPHITHFSFVTLSPCRLDLFRNSLWYRYINLNMHLSNLIQSVIFYMNQLARQGDLQVYGEFSGYRWFKNHCDSLCTCRSPTTGQFSMRLACCVTSTWLTCSAGSPSWPTSSSTQVDICKLFKKTTPLFFGGGGG